MLEERVIHLDQESLELFSLKGTQNGGNVPQMGIANGLKVRRVMQLICDFSKKPFEQLEILDLACGEGVYAIEAAIRGAEVRALDARTERMSEGIKVAERHGLANLSFEQMDIRNVSRDSHGNFDVVLLLGILYHLHQDDVFSVLKNIYEITREFVVIDTHIALSGNIEIEYNHQVYKCNYYREHSEDDSEQVRRSRLLASIDNSTSIWLTKESLFRLLKEVGFSSVCECNVPLEPFKPNNRLTVIASKGKSVKVSSYPWLNDKTEQEIKHILESNHRITHKAKRINKTSIKRRAASWTNSALRPFGLMITRI